MIVHLFEWFEEEKRDFLSLEYYYISLLIIRYYKPRNFEVFFKSVKIVSLSCLRAQSISGVFKRSLSVSLEGEKIHGKNSKYGVSIETYNDYLHVQDGQPHNLQRWKALLPLISQILLFQPNPGLHFTQLLLLDNTTGRGTTATCIQNSFKK